MPTLLLLSSYQISQYLASPSRINLTLASTQKTKINMSSSYAEQMKNTWSDTPNLLGMTETLHETTAHTCHTLISLNLLPGGSSHKSKWLITIFRTQLPSQEPLWGLTHQGITQNHFRFVGDFPEGHISPETGAVPAATILTVVGQQHVVHVALLFTSFWVFYLIFKSKIKTQKCFKDLGSLFQKISGKMMQEESRSGYE